MESAVVDGVDVVDGMDKELGATRGTEATKGSSGETPLPQAPKAEYKVWAWAEVLPTEDNSRSISPKDPAVVALAESIKQLGVLEPVLCRPHPTKPGYLDLRAGARRHCAAGLAGLTTIPCMVREMTDAEAFEVTMAENWQREDLSPMEESRGIGKMLERGWTLEQVSAQCGKSVKWVARRARLQALSAVWRAKSEDPASPISHWSAAHLELVARFPEEVQETLLKGIENEFYSFDEDAGLALVHLRGMTAQAIQALKHAPWDLEDEGLLPGAGSCAACKKRSDCQPELFDSEDWGGGKTVDQGARCLDVACFKEKRAAHVATVVSKQEAKHGTVVKVGSYTMRDEDKSLISPYNVQKCKKSDAGAVPVVNVETGERYWGKKLSGVGGSTASGSGGKKTLKEKRLALEKKRQVWCVEEVKRRVEPPKLGAGAELLNPQDLVMLVTVFGISPNLGSSKAQWQAVHDLAGDPVGVKENLHHLLKVQFVQKLGMDLHQWEWGSQDLNARRIAGLYGWDWAEIEAAAVAAKPEPKSWGKEGTVKEEKKKSTTKNTKETKGKQGKKAGSKKSGGTPLPQPEAAEYRFDFVVPGPGMDLAPAPVVEVLVDTGLKLRFVRDVEGVIDVGYAVELGKGRRDVDPRHNGATAECLLTVPRAAADVVRQVREVLKGKRGKAKELARALEEWWGDYCTVQAACEGCGCTEMDACVDPVSGDSCAWRSEAPYWCTACKPEKD